MLLGDGLRHAHIRHITGPVLGRTALGVLLLDWECNRTLSVDWFPRPAKLQNTDVILLVVT